VSFPNILNPFFNVTFIYAIVPQSHSCSDKEDHGIVKEVNVKIKEECPETYQRKKCSLRGGLTKCIENASP
jgi:hypothetical protein